MQRFLAGLWRHRDFMRLWLGQTISEWGSQLGALGLVALLYLRATPLQMGILGAAGFAPVLLIGLQAGVWVDRLRRRPILIAADLGRALLLLSVPAAALFGTLRIEQLYVVTFLVGLLNVFFNVAYQSILPSLVERSRLVEANSKLGMSSHVAEVGAPALGGLLVQIMSAPLMLVLDALSFVASAIFLLRVRTAESVSTDGVEGQSMWRDVVEGVRAVARSTILRALAGSEGIGTFFGSFYAALYGLYLLDILHLSPFVLGIAIGAGGAGALIGTFLAEPVSRRFGPGGAIIGPMVVVSVLAPLAPLAGGAAWIAIGMLVTHQFVGDLARAIRVINELSLRQALTPDRMLGRTNASWHVIEGAASLLGMLVGGLLGQYLGIRPTLWLAGLGNVLALIWLLRSPVRTLGTQHEPVVEGVAVLS